MYIVGLKIQAHYTKCDQKFPRISSMKAPLVRFLWVRYVPILLLLSLGSKQFQNFWRFFYIILEANRMPLFVKPSLSYLETGRTSQEITVGLFFFFFFSGQSKKYLHKLGSSWNCYHFSVSRFQFMSCVSWHFSTITSLLIDISTTKTSFI